MTTRLTSSKWKDVADALRACWREEIFRVYGYICGTFMHGKQGRIPPTFGMCMTRFYWEDLRMWEFVPSSHHKPTHFRLLHLFVQCSVNDFKSELFFPLFTLFPVCADVPRAFLPCLVEAVDVNLITGDVIKN